VQTISILIPFDQKISSIVIKSTTIQQLPGTYNLFPVQKPVRTDASNQSLPFDKPDLQIYNSAKPYPGILYEITNDGYPMGYHVVTLRFYPLQYIPASKTINLYTAINFTIIYATNTENVLRPNRQSIYSSNLTKKYIQGMVSNPDDINTITGGALEVIGNNTSGNSKMSLLNTMGMSPASLTVIPDYIIITTGSLAPGFQALADWKTKKGVNTIVIKTSDIYSNYQGVDNAEKVRNYLKDAYINFGYLYVLLGGDITDESGNEIVPARVAFIQIADSRPEIYETDYYYATVQGNWNANGNAIYGEDDGSLVVSNAQDKADMSMKFFVGRAPVHTPTEAANFANKVISYENLKTNAGVPVPISNLNYVKNLSFWANSTTFGSSLCSQLNTLDATTGVIPISAGYHVLKLYEGGTGGTDGLTQNNAMACMNTGWSGWGSYGNIHIIYHLDHSGPDNMATSTINHQGIGPSNMDALTNGYSYSILYSDGCHPNDFAKNSVSKHYVNNRPSGSNEGGLNSGGVAFSGNVGSGSGGDHVYFENYFMDALYKSDVSGNSTKVSRYHDYDNANYHIGYLNYWSAYADGTIDKSYLKNRNLLGDPEMMVWTNTPQTTLAVASVYSSSAQTLSGIVSGINTAFSPTLVVTLTICKGTEIWKTQDITATTASVPYSFSAVLADTPGDITITAIAHNYIPSINLLNVPSISGAHPYMTNSTIDDDNTGGSHGNGDAQPDAGETIQLPFTLTNSGNTTASTVTATLSWKANDYQTQSGTNATITIGTNTASFGNIVASGTGNNNSNPFVFTINKTAFDGITPRPLTQYINFTLNTLVNGIPFSAKPFILQIAEPNLIKGENSLTGSLAANSSNQLTIKLYNTGLSQATGLTAILSKNADPSNNITITSTTSSYSNINGTSNMPNYGTNANTFNFNVGNLGAYNSNETFNLSVTNSFGKIWAFTNFNLTVPVATFTTHNTGSLTSINLSWTCNISSPIQGYNLYRRLTSAGGAYSKINTSLIPYRIYLDDGQGTPLNQLTSYDYKLTVVDMNGNESIPSTLTNSIFSVSTSLPFHPGWPITPSSTQITDFRSYGSPNVYDVAGNQNKEIFFSTGFLTSGGVWAFNNDGSRWYSYDGNVTNKEGYIDFKCGSSAAPAIADIDNDGTVEMGVTTHSEDPAGAMSQSLFVYKTIDVNSTPPSNQPTGFPISISGSDMNQSAVFSDINNDGQMEVLTNDMNSSGVKVFNKNGTAYTGIGWPATGYTCGYSIPVAFDFDDDLKKEIVIGCAASTAKSAGIYIFKENGTNYGSSNPVYTPEANYRTDFPPVIADIDNDGTYEIIFISAYDTTAKIFAMKPNGTFISGWDPSGTYPTFSLSLTVSLGNYYGQFCPSLSVGDLNKDGYLEVVCGDNGHLYVWSRTGGNPETTISIPSYSSYYTKAPILADIDNVNTDLEIVITGKDPNTTTATDIYAYKMNGNPVIGFPIYIPDEVLNSPCINDINNDKKNELIVTSGTNFYIWDSQGSIGNNVYGWNCYRHDNYNSGISYNMADGFLYDEDVYLQNITTSSISTDMNRYYFGRNVLIGNDVTTQKSNGDVIFTNGTNATIEATNSVLIKNNTTIPVGCVFEIK
jgi:hypothetical protein